MIISEFYMEMPDGTRLVRTYSSDGKFITRDGEVYEEAIDPADLGRVYEETDELIPVEKAQEEAEDDGEEITEE